MDEYTVSLGRDDEASRGTLFKVDTCGNHERRIFQKYTRKGLDLFFFF
jgi:hypothetical protein